MPVVGFADPTALRRIGDYVREHGSFVSTFYGSNVEVYLNRAKLAAFCGNLAALPHDSGTWFVASSRMERFRSKLRSSGAAPRSGG